MKRNQLELLIILETCATLKEAAGVLQKSPSTVGRTLKSLETELQCTLFQHSRNYLLPTPEGKLVLEYAHTFEELTKKMEQSFLSLSTQNIYHNWSEREVQCLLLIQKYRNLSRAAEELFVSQPALSQMLNTLESSYSIPVFEICRNRLQPTVMGKTLLDYAQKLDTLFQMIRQDLKEFQDLRQGTIKIGIPTSLSSNLIPLIAPAFLNRFPGIKLRILEDQSRKLKHMLKEKQVDFCILHTRNEKSARKVNQTTDDTISYYAYYEEPFFLVIPRRWKDLLALPEDRPLEAADLLELSDIPFVLAAKRQPLRNVIQRIFRNVYAITGTPFNPTACCSSKNMETIRRLVLAETGISFLPTSYLHLYSEQNDLISYPLSASLGGVWSLAIALPKQITLSRSTREFIEVMKKSIEHICIEDTDCPIQSSSQNMS